MSGPSPALNKREVDSQKPWEGKAVLVGVTGGIAAYKAAELIRALRRRGAIPQVVMTRHAEHFITPLTLSELAGRPVLRDLFLDLSPCSVPHIELARSTDLALIVPATANIIAKLAWGLADDALSTIMLAVRAPVLLAPAMNPSMYRHPAVQQNLLRLRSRGMTVVEPEEGEVLCGEEGQGRLASLERILAEAEVLLKRARDLNGRRILVTAGPTREWLDAVRFLSNASSGRMGYAVAEAARDRGATVVLVSGPTSLPPPEGVECVRVETAEEMLRAVLARFSEVEVVIKAAAVADYRPAAPMSGKMKKGKEPLALPLEPTPDILRALEERKSRQILVGFSAEVGDPVPEAWRKLKAKGLDLVVANDVSRPGIGFEAEENAVIILGADGTKEEVAPAPKRVVAERILNHVVRLLNR